MIVLLQVLATLSIQEFILIKQDIRQYLGTSRKKVILGCNKNYVILSLNYTLKNSKRTISVSGIERKSQKNNI